MAPQLPANAVKLKYTGRQLQSYREDPNSGVRRVTDRLHIGLLPAGLANFKEAVIDAVNRDKIGQFDARLDGIVLDVRNIKVLGNQFPIHTDHPELHIDMMADLHVFRPTVGAVIVGVVKHIGKGHISVTIHRVFNVAIRLAGAQPAGLKVNANITIRVTDFDLKDTIPYIAGVLDRPAGVEAKPLKSALKGSKVVATAVVANDDTDSDDSQDDNRSVLVDSRVTIKKEPHTSDSDASDSDSEPDDLNTQQAASDVSQSDTDSEAEAAVVPRPKQYIQIKQEKRSAASQQSASSSSSSSDEDEPDARFPTKTDGIATAKTVARTATNFKREPSLDIEPTDGSDTSDDEPDVPAPLVSVKPEPRKSKMLSSVDSLLQKVLSKKLATDDGDDVVATPTGKSLKRPHRDEANDSLANLTSFASPGLSSTMLPESKANRSKKSKM